MLGNPPRARGRLRAAAGLALLLPATTVAQEAVQELPPVEVVARPAAPAPNAISPRLGTSRYQIGAERIEALPQGANAPLNQVLLQAPGVVQEAAGDIHVRGDHRNLQYRINGVALPEVIGGFGPLLTGRGLSSVSLLTGALPAQYGLRTAGVVELRLKDGNNDPGGSAEVHGGSRGTIQPSLSHGGASGPWSWYASGSMLRSERGLENPTASIHSRHNATEQWRGLLNLNRQLDETTRLVFIAGSTTARYELPTIAGRSPGFAVPGPVPASADLRARQWNRGYFGVAALQKELGALDLQLAAWTRFTSLHYLPDGVGDLAYTGSAADTYRRSVAAGVQADATWRGVQDHLPGFGTYVTRDATRSVNRSTVLPEAGGAPFLIDERDRRTGWLSGFYAQDSWRLRERLTLNYGARFDHMTQATVASQFSPRVNLVWQPEGWGSFSAGYARTFTPPPQELAIETNPLRYAGTSIAPEVLRADPVRPERAHYFNLGANRRFGENLTLGVETYYRQVGMMQDLGQFGSAYIFSPYNYREGRAFGTELTASWRGEKLSLYGNLALSRSEGRGLASNQFFWTSAEQAQVARKYVRTDHDQLVTASAGGSYAAWEGGRVSTTLLYGSGMRRGFANSERATPYMTVNLGVAQEFNLPDGGRWTLRLDVVNLLDRRYQLRDGTGIGVGAPQYGVRRGYFLGLAHRI